MTRDDYKALIMPAIEESIDLFIMFENKYGEGITLSGKDQLKSVSHGIQALQGRDNPDGKSHAVAALNRSIKAVLAELEND